MSLVIIEAAIRLETGVLKPETCCILLRASASRRKYRRAIFEISSFYPGALSP